MSEYYRRGQALIAADIKIKELKARLEKQSVLAGVEQCKLEVENSDMAKLLESLLWYKDENQLLDFVFVNKVRKILLRRGVESKPKCTKCNGTKVLKDYGNDEETSPVIIPCTKCDGYGVYEHTACVDRALPVRCDCEAGMKMRRAAFKKEVE